MADIEKVIKGLEICRHRVISQENCMECPYIYDSRSKQSNCEGVLHWDALALLREQEEREQRICKSICNFVRGACSTDTDDDKDFVCYEIQKCFTESR